MAATTVQFNVTGNAATQLAKILTQLGKVNNQVAKTSQTFNSFNGILGRLAIGAFIVNTLRAADAVDDLAKATGLTVAAINGLGSAFLANGGDAEVAQNSILKLQQTLEDAAQGGIKASANLARLGLSFEQLRTLTPDDQVKAVIQALGKLPAGAQRTALAMELLGKSARTVDFDGVNKDLDGFIQKSKEAEPGLKEAAKLFNNIQNAGKAFGNELLNQAQPITASLNKLAENTDKIAKSLAELVRILAIAGAAFLIFTKILPAVTSVGNAIFKAGSAGAFFSKQIKSILLNLVRLPQNLAAFLASLVGLGKAFEYTAKRAGGLKSLAAALLNIVRIGLRLAGIVGIIWAVAEAVNFLSKKIFDFDLFKWFGEQFDYAIGKAREFLEMLGILDKKTSERPGRPGGGRGQGGMPAAGAATAPPGEDPMASFRSSVKDITRAYAEQNAERVKGLNLERLYLGMTENQVELQKAVGAVVEENFKAVAELEAKKAAMSADEKALGGVKIIDAEIKKLKERLETDKMATRMAVEGLQARRAETEKMLAITEQLKMALDHSETLTQLQEEVALVGLYGQELEKATEILNADRQLRETIKDITKDLLDLKAKEATMNADEFQRELDRHQERIRMAYELRDAQVNTANESRKKREEVDQSYNEGFKRGLEDISESMKPVKIAQKAVENGWAKMGDALDTFVETGKLNFADLARSIILDITKMIAKMLLFKAIEAGLNALFPGLGTAFSAGARANGGPVQGKRPYLVGEKGPELFVPPNNGSIVPNSKLGGGQMVNAPVTNNNVTYNVSAIDAKGVAQFFYENRKAMLGTVTMARKETPYGG